MKRKIMPDTLINELSKKKNQYLIVTGDDSSFEQRSLPLFIRRALDLVAEYADISKKHNITCVCVGVFAQRSQ